MTGIDLAGQRAELVVVANGAASKASKTEQGVAQSATAENQAARGETKPAGSDTRAKKPGTLRIVRALNANHFLEAVTGGFLNLTTVYDPAPGSTKHPAVHSRHFGVLGEPVYAQYTGFCE
ncbi:MAG: hypothetical protein AAGG72_04020 [Pseudomonadota bacterium]